MMRRDVVVRLQAKDWYTYNLQYTRMIRINLNSFSLVGKWADPSGTAILGQPVTKPEQAPQLHPLSKISLISKGTHGPRIRY